jgi:hypothetical protein
MPRAGTAKGQPGLRRVVARLRPRARTYADSGLVGRAVRDLVERYDFGGRA